LEAMTIAVIATRDEDAALLVDARRITIKFTL
jgi:hypothetical protein